jgi:hypothetical protein
MSFDLPLQIFIEVLSYPSLQLASEDLLYDIISSRFEVDAGYSALVEYLRIEYLSVDRISSLIQWISNHFESFNFGIWRSLSTRLKHEVRGLSPNSRLRFRGVHHELNIDTPLVGIIASLTHRYGGNVHDRGIVTTSSKTVYSGDYAAKNAVDLTATNFLQSQSQANQWICYNFNNRWVRPTHYSISSSGHFLRSWVVEGSIDNVNWNELDRHEGDPEISSNHQIGTFAIPVYHDVDYRFIRLRQTGQNAGGSDYLRIVALELFGYLIE